MLRPLNILVAPNAFKESLSAMEAAEAISQGLKKILVSAKITSIPIADGGDGTLEAIVEGTGGRILKKRVVGPLGNEVIAEYGITGDGQTAIIEMSRASGLHLVPIARRNPMVTTSFGTGQLIAAALDRGVKKVILGIGGSATVDGGLGALQALGAAFLDQQGKPVGSGGHGLHKLRSIDFRRLHLSLRHARILVACDVDNPMVGPKGAAAVFGPQKGATPSMVKQLDNDLAKLAKLIAKQTGRHVAHLPGTGAAGGISGSLKGLLGAQLKPGSELVFDLLGIKEILPKMDFVVTGEGRIDFQTPHGKGPGMLARLAKQQGIPVIGVAGAISDDVDLLFKLGFTALFSIVNRPMDLSVAMKQAPELIRATAEQVARLIQAVLRMSHD